MKCNEGGDYPEFYRQLSATARKSYRCYECERMILRGDLYRRHVAKCDGDVYSMTVCESCERVRELVRRHEIREGTAPYESIPALGALREYAEEMNGRLLEFGESLDD